MKAGEGRFGQRRLSWRWVARVMNRDDIHRRPRLTAWICVVVAVIILGFGALGYVVPVVLSKLI